jgi:hypothetical protein
MGALQSIESVWVRFGIENGTSVDFRVLVYGNDIIAVQVAVKEQIAELLTHCAAAELQVFLQGATNPSRADANIPPTTLDNPLIVRAPPIPQQGGTLCRIPSLCLSFLLSFFLI